MAGAALCAARGAVSRRPRLSPPAGARSRIPARAAPRRRRHDFALGAGACGQPRDHPLRLARSEEHTSELQSLMRNSYAVLCLKTKKTTNKTKSIDEYNYNQ